MIPELQAWLNGGREYNLGVILYQKFGAMAEPQNVVSAEAKILLTGRHEKKLLGKLMELWNKTKEVESAKLKVQSEIQNASSSIDRVRQGLPSVLNTPAKMLQQVAQEPVKNARHWDNGTVNVKCGDNSIMKLHLRLVERVNGMELVMGVGGLNQMGYKDFLKSLYSGVRLDLVVCKLNRQKKTGGDRVSLKGVMSTVHRPWIDHVVDDTIQYAAKSQRLLMELRSTWLPWWGEMCDAHSKLKVVNEPEERRELAMTIVELESKCRKCWEAAAYVKLWGCLPAGFVLPKVKAKKVVSTGADMMRELQNTVALISKNRKKLKHPLAKEKLKVRWIADLVVLVDKRNRLRKELGLPEIKE